MISAVFLTVCRSKLLCDTNIKSNLTDGLCTVATWMSSWHGITASVDASQPTASPWTRWHVCGDGAKIVSRPFRSFRTVGGSKHVTSLSFFLALHSSYLIQNNLKQWKDFTIIQNRRPRPYSTRDTRIYKQHALPYHPVPFYILKLI